MKATNGKFEIEGTPLEMREFFLGEEETPTAVSMEPVVRSRRIQRHRRRKKLYQIWSHADDKFLLENWKQPTGQGDRSKFPHNKKVAKELGRSYDGAHVRFRVLKKEAQA